MARTSCVITTLRPINNEFSPDPYILASKPPIYLRPLSNDCDPRRLSLPPLIIPAQPSRPPPPVPVAAANQSRSHTNHSTFSPPPSASTGSKTNFVDLFRFQNPCLLPPSLSSTPTTVSSATSSSSPRNLNNRKLSYEQTPIQFKYRRQSTSSSQQHQYLPQPGSGHQFGLCRSPEGNVTPLVHGREPRLSINSGQDNPEHIQDCVSRRRTRLPPRRSERRLGLSTATFEARQRAGLVDLVEIFANVDAVGAGSDNDFEVKDVEINDVGGISVGGRYRSSYYHSRSPGEGIGFDGESMEVETLTGVSLNYNCSVESDERELMSRGLKKISAEEYCEDISLIPWMAFDE